MYHLVDNFTNIKGDALVGYFVKLKVPGGAHAPLFADVSSTPIISVSGIADTAITDSNGQFDFYVADGDYDIEFFDAGDVTQKVRTIASVPMYGGAASAELDAAVTAAQTARTGAELAQTLTEAQIDALSAPTGAAQVGFQHSATADVETVQHVLRQQVLATSYGADKTGVADSRAAFIAAAAAAGVGGCIVVPSGTYEISDVVDILAGQTWRFEGVTLTHTDDTKTILRANSVDGWAIEGSLVLEGLLTTAATTAETGLRITNGSRYRVQGVTAKLFKGKGIYLDGIDPGTYRGDRGQFTDCAAHECTAGLQIDAGAGAEYQTFSNFTASGNITGVLIGAGNIVFAGGNVVDNTTGVRLVNGTNHGHGMFIGTNINHNNSENIHATGVTNGYTFIGCHIYGNGTSTGVIWFEGCKGMLITGGIIDCWIYNDSGAGSGANYVTNNYFPGDSGVTLQSNNAALDELTLIGNFDGAGPSSLNTPEAASGITNWVKFHWDGAAVVIDGGTTGIAVIRNGVGDYTIGWGAVFPTDDYSLSISLDTNASGHLGGYAIGSHGTTSVRIFTYGQNGGATTQMDPRFVWARAEA